jgi:hypothetical protein
MMKRGAPIVLDGKPGPLPEIRMTSTGILYVMAPFGPHADKLVLICDDDGAVSVAIKREHN